MKMVNYIASLALVVLTLQSNHSLGEKGLPKSVSKYIAAQAKIIGGNSKLGVIINPVWDENPEVGKFRTLSDKERVAAIVATIDYLQENNNKLFNEPGTRKRRLQAKATVFLLTYKYLYSLTKNTEYDHLLIEYIVNDASDLELMMRDEKSYSKYLSSRDARFDHLLINLLIDEGFASAYVGYKLTENNLPNALANKISLLSLIGTCSAMIDICTSK